MGTYRIVIEGQGTHHNDPERHESGALVDAEKATAELVQHLAANGHRIDTARFELPTITNGLTSLAEDILTGEKWVLHQQTPPSYNLTGQGAPAQAEAPAGGQV